MRLGGDSTRVVGRWYASGLSGHFLRRKSRQGRGRFMNADSDIYFMHANALSSAFFFGVRNVGIVSNELVLCTSVL